MNRMIARTFCLTLIATVAMVSMSHAKDEVKKESVKKKPVVQIAILLDNSGSMSGLINQARSELWKVVNEFIEAKLGGVRPDLLVAVYK